jgi:hypothetical protein
VIPAEGNHAWLFGQNIAPHIPVWERYSPADGDFFNGIDPNEMRLPQNRRRARLPSKRFRRA